MRSRAGPLGVLAFLAIFCLAVSSSGCQSTRAKLGALTATAGELISTTGEIVTGIADVLINGPAEDAKAATDSIGITAPSAAPALPPLPVQPAAPPAGPSGALPHEEDLTAPDPRQVTARVLDPFDERLRRAHAAFCLTANRAPALFRRT